MHTTHQTHLEVANAIFNVLVALGSLISIIGVIYVNVIVWVGVAFGSFAVLAATVGAFCAFSERNGRKLLRDLDEKRDHPSCPVYSV